MGQIIFDFHQLPPGSLMPLRQTLLQLLAAYAKGPKPIRTQLCVCLANVAIQMLQWKDVMETVVSTLGNDEDSIACVLEFLHVLPEEVTEGRKINLTEDDLRRRTEELLDNNASMVIRLLTQYAQSSPTATHNPQLMDCITSWIREVPLADIASSPLMDGIMQAVQSETSFDAAVETLCAIFRETRDVDDNAAVIGALYPRLAQLQPRIGRAAAEGDWETFKGVTRIFAEAGEAWVILMVREPQRYRPLAESILECCLRDEERDSLSQTFNFWFELKQYVTLDRYIESRMQYVDIYSKLVDIMIRHLEFPESDTDDYFEGDRDAEEKFREFRHQMGDVLKGCCEVIGVTECLQKSYALIEQWVQTYGPQAQGSIPRWQKLEAPLFSMRAMGRMVPSNESIMLPRLIPLIVQIPNHDKVRFQAVMALGRYTEWTSQHPETLQDQLDFIMACFSHSDKEVVRAAALGFQYFCQDCADLLKDYLPQLQRFYEANLDALPSNSQDEITAGLASVLNKQPLLTLYDSMELCCGPVMKRLMDMAQRANTKEDKLAIADKLNLITIFVQSVIPHVEADQPHPAVRYCENSFSVLAAICDRFVDCVPIVERICRCWRYMVLSYRTHTTPLLPQLADKLAAGFTASRQGCFLWATDSIVREFSDVSEVVPQSTTDAIYTFYEQQATTFLRALNDLAPEELPDVIEDFFRLSGDVLLYHSHRLIASGLNDTILRAAATSLTLLKEEPLIATLHFLRDFIAYGQPDAPSSSFQQNGSYTLSPNPPEVQSTVKALLLARGEEVLQRCVTGMMQSFPLDCFPDASGVLLALFELLPQPTSQWLAATVALLPPGSISEPEKERLLSNVQQRVEAGEVRKVRALLQDFCNGYRRRNVAPREGLGGLDGAGKRFTFAG